MQQIIVLKENQSDHFDLIQYPDKQRNIQLHIDKLSAKYPVEIHCRIKNFDELEVLICLVASLKKNDYFIERIRFVYLFGMRSDRAFDVGQPNYFRDVVAPIINSFNIKKVSFFCPHSVISLDYIVNHELRHENLNWGNILPCDFEKIFIFGDQNNYLLDSCIDFSIYAKFCFIKSRNETIYVSLPDINLNFLKSAHAKKDTIIIADDLCDAGGTFIAEAKYLRENGILNPLYLYVSHGLFTKGVDILTPYFDKIICTNSYQEINHPNVHVIKVI